MCWLADFVFPLDKACQPVTPVSCFCILSQVVFIINTLVWVEPIFSTNSRQESEYLRNLRIYLRKVQRFLHLISVSSHEVCHITHLFFFLFFKITFTHWSQLTDNITELSKDFSILDCESLLELLNFSTLHAFIWMQGVSRQWIKV